jgi:hypothetical protein
VANVSFPTWPVDGPLPVPPVNGLLPTAAAPAAGVRFVVDTDLGPVDENSIAPGESGLETGLYRRADGSIWMRQAGGAEDSQVFVPTNAGRERWLNSVEVYPYPPDVPEGWDTCAPASTRGEKSFGTPLAPPDFRALTLSVPITCTAQQVPDEAAFRARAVAVLTATESFGVARALMSGENVDGGRYLADSGCAFPNAATATAPNHGVQVLEEAIAETGRLGLIHCSPMLATALMGSGFALSDKTGAIRTINGNVVIPDDGYVGASEPDMGTPPGPTEEWAYASGPVDIRHSEIFTTPDTRAQALDRGLGATTGRTNQFTYRAERYSVAIWDTALQAAVLIDRCQTECVVPT